MGDDPSNNAKTRAPPAIGRHPGAPGYVPRYGASENGVYTRILRLIAARASGAPRASERGLSTIRVRWLETLVADLLDASRMRMGWLPIRPVPVDLGALAQQVVDDFSFSPDLTPAHRIVVDVPGDVDGVWDPARLLQVLTNLVSNGLKFSPRGGTVRISVRGAADRVDISVSDEGIGIPVEQLPTLFRPFSRGNAPSRSISGTGLGLYISNRIVQRLGGSMSVVSEVGVGTTVTVHLPRVPPPEP